MIDVYRQGRSGSLAEENGPVLVCDFGSTVVKAVFDGTPLEYRYMHTRHGRLVGFAPEDRLWISPVSQAEVERGLRRDVGVRTDPGCDIFLELGRNAGVGIDTRDGWPRFDIVDICDNPEDLLRRGIETLALPSLYRIEEERIAREEWGMSRVDPTWRSVR